LRLSINLGHPVKDNEIDVAHKRHETRELFLKELWLKTPKAKKHLGINSVLENNIKNIKKCGTRLLAKSIGLRQEA
jgi:hypothetical protein